MCNRRGQAAQCRCLFKATDHTPTRTPSIGLMPDLAIEPERRGLLVLHVRVRALQHPSRASASMPFLCRGRSRRTALPCPTLMRLAAHLGVAGKMPRTDFCNRHYRLEHPTSIARLPNPQLFTAAKTASSQRIPSLLFKKGPKHLGEHGVGPPFGNPAPGEAALDGATPARARCFTFPPPDEEGIGPLPGGSGHLGAAFSASPEARRSDL